MERHISSLFVLIWYCLVSATVTLILPPFLSHNALYHIFFAKELLAGDWLLTNVRVLPSSLFGESFINQHWLFHVLWASLLSLFTDQTAARWLTFSGILLILVAWRKVAQSFGVRSLTLLAVLPIIMLLDISAFTEIASGRPNPFYVAGFLWLLAIATTPTPSAWQILLASAAITKMTYFGILAPLMVLPGAMIHGRKHFRFVGVSIGGVALAFLSVPDPIGNLSYFWTLATSNISNDYHIHEWRNFTESTAERRTSTVILFMIALVHFYWTAVLDRSTRSRALTIWILGSVIAAAFMGRFFLLALALALIGVGRILKRGQPKWRAIAATSLLIWWGSFWQFFEQRASYNGQGSLFLSDDYKTILHHPKFRNARFLNFYWEYWSAQIYQTGSDRFEPGFAPVAYDRQSSLYQLYEKFRTNPSLLRELDLKEIKWKFGFDFILIDKSTLGRIQRSMPNRLLRVVFVGKEFVVFDFYPFALMSELTSRKSLRTLADCEKGRVEDLSLYDPLEIPTQYLWINPSYADQDLFELHKGRFSCFVRGLDMARNGKLFAQVLPGFQRVTRWREPDRAVQIGPPSELTLSDYRKHAAQMLSEFFLNLSEIQYRFDLQYGFSDEPYQLDRKVFALWTICRAHRQLATRTSRAACEVGLRQLSTNITTKNSFAAAYLLWAQWLMLENNIQDLCRVRNETLDEWRTGASTAWGHSFRSEPPSWGNQKFTLGQRLYFWVGTMDVCKESARPSVLHEALGLYLNLKTFDKDWVPARWLLGAVGAHRRLYPEQGSIIGQFHLQQLVEALDLSLFDGQNPSCLRASELLPTDYRSGQINYYVLEGLAQMFQYGVLFHNETQLLHRIRSCVIDHLVISLPGGRLGAPVTDWQSSVTIDNQAHLVNALLDLVEE